MALGPTSPLFNGDPTAALTPDDAACGNSGGLIGGPLLSDVAAAQAVTPTQKSTIELGPNAQGNAAANNYFELNAISNPQAYLAQLQSFWSTANSWSGVTERIDGACPLVNPTSAEIAQWACDKWGINPVECYAEATIDGHWDQTGIGDNGGSVSAYQVAYRRQGHGWAGLLSSDLPAENTCFAADFFAGHLFAAYHGLTGETGACNLNAAVQTWLNGRGGGNSWSNQITQAINTQAWMRFFPSGMTIAGGAPAVGGLSAVGQ
jgi:hypothetical protein